MTSDRHDDRLNPSTEYLGRVIAEYLLAAGSAGESDVEALIAEHSEIAGELREFFAAHEQLRRRGGKREAISNSTGDESTLPFCSIPPGTLAPERHPGGSDKSINVAPPPRRVEEQPARELSRFGDYELIEEIARGGMGIVYKAKQLSLNRIVALKMIRGGQLATHDQIRRFRIEAGAAAKLDHPSIVPIFEVGQVGDQHFFSMGYVAGGTLTDKVRTGPLPSRMAAEYVMKIAEAVAYAHQRGVIHRDLKPGNVLLDANGEPRVTDFGLAKQLEDDGDLTASGQILGTPAYMSPEQATGRKGDISTQADVYSLGAILYHLLTGQPPFQAESPLDVMLQVLDREPEPPSKHNRSIPHVLERICQRAMEKHPEDRYESAARLAADLRHFLMDEPITLPKDRWRHRLKRWWRREPLLAAHWAGILATMFISWSHKFVYGTDLDYVLRHTYAFSMWAAVCWGLQQWMNIARWRETACLAWGAIDALLFTMVLYMAAPPRGALLVGYAVLIASSGLFLRVRYVWFMTSASLLALFALVLLHKDDLWNTNPHYIFIIAACLGVVGLAVGTMVKQVRMLRRYYEHEA